MLGFDILFSAASMRMMIAPSNYQRPRLCQSYFERLPLTSKTETPREEKKNKSNLVFSFILISQECILPKQFMKDNETT